MTQSRILCGLLLFQSGSLPSWAIIFVSTDNALYNTSEPVGTLAGSGWQYLGNWNGFVGTQISPSHFITATHVGGSVGGSFTGSNGQSYTTTAVTQLNDLAIWTVSGNLPTVAPLYLGSNEGNLDMVVFGRGVGRGAELTANDATDANKIRGWAWGGNSALRWGTNRFEVAYANYPVVGPAMSAGFDRLGGDNEATVGSGDSGGATFVLNGGKWELAGVVYGVQSNVRTTPSGTPVNGAIYDFGGLYGASNGQLIIADEFTDIPASFVVSRISADSNQQWILTSVPESSSYLVSVAALLSCWAGYRTFRRTEDALGQVDRRSVD